MSSFGFEHGARRVPGGIRLEVADLGDEKNHLQQELEVLLLLRRHLDHDGLATPCFWREAEVGKLLLHPLGIRIGLVDLVDRDEDRHAGRLGVVDGLLRLWHDAIVGRDNQDDDVGDTGAARAHHRERFVTGSIQEDDVAVVHLDGVSADVLGDAACLAFGDARRTDRIEQRGLAVVDVAHDGHDGSAGHAIRLVDVFRLDLQHLLFEALHLHVGAEVARDHGGGFVVERAVDIHHEATIHQLLQDVLRLDVEFCREIGDGHAFRERDRARDRWRR